MLSLTALNCYPVKSCRGRSLTEAVVEPWGLAGDRRWMLVDPAGVLVTAREIPHLLLATPTPLPDGGLRVTYPDTAPLTVAVPAPGALTSVQVWSSTLDATPAADAAHEWFSGLLGRPVRLVYLDDPTRRHPNPRFTTATDYVSFADAYPLLLTTTGSLDALNELIDRFGRADEGPLPMTRFRPSVVVDGSEPWAEDGWRRLRIGDAIFRVVKGCDRCTMTMTDPDTAARGKEPIATLAKFRRWDGEVWFGMNLVPDTPGVRVRVGDEVEILDCEPAPDGPPR